MINYKITIYKQMQQQLKPECFAFRAKVLSVILNVII